MTSSCETTPGLIIRQATDSADIAAVKECFNAYTEWLNVDITFQNYSSEFDGLPGKYAPPTGALLLASDATTNQILGCVAMRPIQIEPKYLSNRPENSRFCELKRLFVYPEARGRQVAKKLMEEVMRVAREEGYNEMLLDTLSRMEAAIKLYTFQGFDKTDAYYGNPLEGVIYFSKKLK